jgi:hypothetical protein
MQQHKPRLRSMEHGKNDVLLALLELRRGRSLLKPSWRS